MAPQRMDPPLATARRMTPALTMSLRVFQTPMSLAASDEADISSVCQLISDDTCFLQRLSAQRLGFSESRPGVLPSGNAAESRRKITVG
jgi:hypothetical protein